MTIMPIMTIMKIHFKLSMHFHFKLSITSKIPFHFVLIIQGYCNFCKNRGLGKCFVFDKSKNIFFDLFFLERYMKIKKSRKLQKNKKYMKKIYIFCRDFLRIHTYEIFAFQWYRFFISMFYCIFLF